MGAHTTIHKRIDPLARRSGGPVHISQLLHKIKQAATMELKNQVADRAKTQERLLEEADEIRNQLDGNISENDRLNLLITLMSQIIKIKRASKI